MLNKTLNQGANITVGNLDKCYIIDEYILTLRTWQGPRKLFFEAFLSFFIQYFSL